MMKLEELKQELVETKNKCAEIEKKINELARQTSEVRWKAGKGDSYYYILSTGKTDEDKDIDCAWENDRYNIGNYFRTREEAEKTIEKIKIYTQLKDLALRLNAGEEINWKNYKQAKYSIFYNSEMANLLDGEAYLCQRIGQIYCLDENFLDIAKQEIGKENLIKLFV